MARRLVASSLLLAVAVALVLLLATSVPSVAAQDAEPYNSTLSLQLLHLAGAAYCPEPVVQAWNCSFCSEVNDFKLYGVEYNSTTDMLAYVGYLSDLNSIVITFRGTALTSILDWLEDLNFWSVPAICPKCEVHQGFLAAYLSIRDATVTFVRDLVAIYPDAKIVITGHSLGGALSYLASVDLALNQGIKADTMYTFGQPRVGNAAFSAAWADLFSNSTAYRVTHGLDPVPHLPPRLLNFVHPPTEVYYDSLNTDYRVCDGSGEDPNCADQWLLPVGATDHVTYLGIDFLNQFLKCIH